MILYLKMEMISRNISRFIEESIKAKTCHPLFFLLYQNGLEDVLDSKCNQCLILQDGRLDTYFEILYADDKCLFFLMTKLNYN